MSQPISKSTTSTARHSWSVEYEFDANQIKNLLTSLENLRRQQHGTDVEFLCKDGSVYAHKMVLISSCDYFKAMFTTKMSEEASGIANFTTTSRNAMDFIVEYLYTGRTTHEFTDRLLLMDVLNTCHLMQLENLLQAVWNTTIECLNDENFCAIWKIGIKLDLITSENDPIIEFAINHRRISKYLQIFDETEMESLVFFMITKGETYIPAVYIIAWNWYGSRDEGAARLMENCDLKSLSNRQLYHACMYACQRKQRSEESIFFDEAFIRLKMARR